MTTGPDPYAGGYEAPDGVEATISGQPDDAPMDATVVKLHSTTDAQVWAQEWCRIARDIRGRGDEIIDEGWMIGWFANAIEIGRDAGNRLRGSDLNQVNA